MSMSNVLFPSCFSPQRPSQPLLFHTALSASADICTQTPFLMKKIYKKTFLPATCSDTCSKFEQGVLNCASAQLLSIHTTQVFDEMQHHFICQQFLQWEKRWGPHHKFLMFSGVMSQTSTFQVKQFCDTQTANLPCKYRPAWSVSHLTERETSNAHTFLRCFDP